MALQPATLTNVSVNPVQVTQVMFNPTDYGIDRGATYTELDVPGLSTPILQFVRGEAQTLSLALFLDGSDARLRMDGMLSHLPFRARRERVESLVQVKAALPVGLL